MVYSIGEYDSYDVYDTSFTQTITDETTEPKSTLEQLEEDLRDKIRAAEENNQYGELANLCDQVLELTLKQLREQLKGFDFPLFELFVKAEFLPEKAYFLLLDNQLEEAANTCTTLIDQIRAQNSPFITDREALKIRAAAYLLAGKRDLGIADLRDCTKPVEYKDVSEPFQIRQENLEYEDRNNILFMQVLGEKIGEKLVEIPNVSQEEFEKMNTEQKVFYFLTQRMPHQALELAANDSDFKVIALAQLGEYEEAWELGEQKGWDRARELTRLMQGDLTLLEDEAEMNHNIVLLALVHYLKTL